MSTLSGHIEKIRCSKCGTWSFFEEGDQRDRWYCIHCGAPQNRNEEVEDIDQELELIDEIINDEIQFALRKYGHFNTMHEAYAIILEELDEFWDSVKANNPDPRELVQVCAMAKLALIDLNRIIVKVAERSIFHKSKILLDTRTEQE